MLIFYLRRLLDASLLYSIKLFITMVEAELKDLIYVDDTLLP